jgi:arylsulfatase A-like enzyme
MKAKPINNQWNWKFWLLFSFLLAHIIGIVDFFIKVDMSLLPLSEIYSLLSLSYFWLINSIIGLILFLFSTLILLPYLLKKQITYRKMLIAYLGIPLFILINLAGLSLTSAPLAGLSLFHPKRVVNNLYIFLTALFLSFFLAWLSIWLKKKNLLGLQVFKILSTALITITFCSISLVVLINITIFKIGYFPQQYRVITSSIKGANEIDDTTLETIGTTPRKTAMGNNQNVISADISNRLNVIFISIDTLRADHLSCYGYDKLNTKNIDDLAKRGVRFAKAYTSIPITLPSHSSMMTGLYPMHHGALSNRFYLSHNNLTLAEILNDHGYTTAAFISAFPLSARFNFNQGFQYFNNERSRQSLAVIYPLHSLRSTWLIHHLYAFRFINLSLDRKAKDVNNAAIRWLKIHHKKPFFIFMHFFDPHSPYIAPRKYNKLMYHPNINAFESLKRYYPLNKTYPYNSEIAYVDEEIGRLIHSLEALRILNKTIIIFIADHGEGLGDHNYMSHGQRVYQEQLHVPLFVVYPPIIPKGKVVEKSINIVNIMPTILDMLKIPIPQGIDSSSLLPFIFEEEKKSSTPIYATAWYFQPSSFYRYAAVIKDNWKLICHLENKKRDQLYNLQDDPKEQYNLEEKEKKVIAELKPLLIKWVMKIPKDSFKNNIAKDKETINRLKALGYLN